MKINEDNPEQDGTTGVNFNPLRGVEFSETEKEQIAKATALMAHLPFGILDSIQRATARDARYYRALRAWTTQGSAPEDARKVLLQNALIAYASSARAKSTVIPLQLF